MVCFRCFKILFYWYR